MENVKATSSLPSKNGSENPKEATPSQVLDSGDFADNMIDDTCLCLYVFAMIYM